jgi:hypothetical protein
MSDKNMALPRATLLNCLSATGLDVPPEKNVIKTIYRYKKILLKFFGLNISTPFLIEVHQSILPNFFFVKRRFFSVFGC